MYRFVNGTTGKNDLSLEHAISASVDQIIQAIFRKFDQKSFINTEWEKKKNHPGRKLLDRSSWLIKKRGPDTFQDEILAPNLFFNFFGTCGKAWQPNNRIKSIGGSVPVKISKEESLSSFHAQYCWEQYLPIAQHFPRISQVDRRQFELFVQYPWNLEQQPRPSMVQQIGITNLESFPSEKAQFQKECFSGWKSTIYPWRKGNWATRVNSNILILQQTSLRNLFFYKNVNNSNSSVCPLQLDIQLLKEDNLLQDSLFQRNSKNEMMFKETPKMRALEKKDFHLKKHWDDIVRQNKFLFSWNTWYPTQKVKATLFSLFSLSFWFSLSLSLKLSHSRDLWVVGTNLNTHISLTNRQKSKILTHH